MDTEFYKIMKEKLRDSELSISQFSKQCGLHRQTLIDFFNEGTKFRPLRNSTMGKIHRSLGIPYDVMDDYNREILKQRKGD